MSVDRKSSNGKGTARHETNGSGLSTTVQTISGGKSMVSELKGEYSSDVGDQYLVGEYAASNRADAQRLAKGRRKYSKDTPPTQTASPGPSPKGGKGQPPKKGKGQPAPKAGSRDDSPYDEYISEQAARYRKSGEAMGNQNQSN